MEIKKILEEDVLPSCFQMTCGQLFIKSPVEDLIVLWRPPISSTASFVILSHPKWSGISSSKMTFVGKRKLSLLKKASRLECLKFARYHENWTVEDWKKILWSDETKINRIGSDGRTYTWKKKGSHFLTELPLLQSSMEEGTILWCRVVWGRIE